MQPNKDTLHEVIGKPFRSIVFRLGGDACPETMPFLVFEDDAGFELFGQEIGLGRSACKGEGATTIENERWFSDQASHAKRKISCRGI